MTRELSDLLIILVAIGLPTVAVLLAVVLPRHARERSRVAQENSELRAENSKLRGELAGLRTRVGEVERLVTDDGARLDRKIETLRVING